MVFGCLVVIRPNAQNDLSLFIFPKHQSIIPYY